MQLKESQPVPAGRPCGSLSRQYSFLATASCRTAFVVKSNAAAVPPVASHQSMMRCRCASCAGHRES